MVKKISLFAIGAFIVSLVIYLSGYARETNASQKQQLSPVLNIYNWEDYLAPSVLSDFEQRFGVKINLQTFEDEDEILSSLQSESGKFDLIILSDRLVGDMLDSGLFAEINLKNIPNFKNIEQRFTNLETDPENQYSVPYLWGTTGIVYNTQVITDTLDSWSVLWNPAYRGNIGMLNSAVEVVACALKYLGYSLRNVSDSQLQEASSKLIEQRPLVRGYKDPMSLTKELISGNLWLALLYSGDAKKAMFQNKTLRYIIPKEGASLWVDNFCIPKESQNKYTAEIFINYILEPKVSAKNANYLGYANCNLAARAYTLKEILEDTGIYPSEEILEKCELFKNRGKTPEEISQREQLMNKIWSELQGPN